MKKIFIFIGSVSILLTSACTINVEEARQSIESQVNSTAENLENKAKEESDKAIQKAKDSVNQKIDDTVEKLREEAQGSVDNKFDNLKDNLTIE